MTIAHAENYVIQPRGCGLTRKNPTEEDIVEVARAELLHNRVSITFLELLPHAMTSLAIGITSCPDGMTHYRILCSQYDDSINLDNTVIESSVQTFALNELDKALNCFAKRLLSDDPKVPWQMEKKAVQPYLQRTTS